MSLRNKAGLLHTAVVGLTLLIAAVGVFPQTLPPITAPEEKAVEDSVKADSLAGREPEVRVIKRDSKPREQLVIGTAVLVFIVTVMVLSNNFNPE
jgi:hypothetical protein